VIGGSAYRLAIVLASVFFLARAGRLIVSRGPVELTLPATVVSNGPPGQRELEGYLLFLADVRRSVPAGASVAVLRPDPEFLWGTFDHRVAIGQLPENDVLPLQAVLGAGSGCLDSHCAAGTDV
jgi:hypothetical protein